MRYKLKTPKKERYKHTLVIVDSLNKPSGLSHSLEKFFQQTRFREPPDFIPRLCNSLRDPIAYYSSEVPRLQKQRRTITLRSTLPRRVRGNRPNIGVAVLIADCYWSLWYARRCKPRDPLDSPNVPKASECVRLAKHIHFYLTGNIYAFTMERQAKHAKMIIASSPQPTHFDF